MKRKIKRVKAYPIKTGELCQKCIFNTEHCDAVLCEGCPRLTFYKCECLLIHKGESCKDFKRRE